MMIISLKNSFFPVKKEIDEFPEASSYQTQPHHPIKAWIEQCTFLGVLGLDFPFFFRFPFSSASLSLDSSLSPTSAAAPIPSGPSTRGTAQGSFDWTHLCRLFVAAGDGVLPISTTSTSSTDLSIERGQGLGRHLILINNGSMERRGGGELGFERAAARAQVEKMAGKKKFPR